ncbi:transcription antitermination factor NusB [Gracilimonas mengyeensis]|uniref:Transcription antitermination protein NusB n=1 Tax=Gracilimonas mengyeensis TaxID=1302730 RepID=A0A521FGY8_9BACT|nr:transcription antitermination factor NusB [Gracilimonas mengyeensis]SMO95385.1 NusB antitermination factor [Gracilimonas mengyeensis]
MINRRKVRETVLQALYAHQLGEYTPSQVVDTIIKKEDFSKEKELRRFAERLFFRTLEHEEELDEITSKHIRNWDIQRLALIDRLVLRIAICELLYFEEIPTKVSINEAIEIAKRYSTAKSGRFINGILDAALTDLDEQGRINKKGRGLIQKTLGN